MRRIIHQLRKKPEHVRTHVLHITTIVFGVVLVTLWVYSLGSSFAEDNTKTQIGNVIQPFSALKDNLVDGYKSISTESSGLKVAE